MNYNTNFGYKTPSDWEDIFWTKLKGHYLTSISAGRLTELYKFTKLIISWPVVPTETFFFLSLSHYTPAHHHELQYQLWLQNTQ